MNDDSLDLNRIEKRARKNAETNAGRRIPRDIQPSPTKDRRDDVSAILQSDETQQAKDTANVQKNTGNSRTLPAFYHQTFEGKTQAELLEMRDWPRDKVPEQFSMAQWKAMIRKQLNQWAARAMAPDDATGPKPSGETGKQEPSPPSSKVAPDDREKLSQPPSEQTPAVQLPGSNLPQEQPSPTPPVSPTDRPKQDPVSLPGPEYWPPLANLSPADRELLNTPVNSQIIGDPKVFQRWAKLNAGEHPETGAEFDKEQEAKTYKQEKEQSDAQAITSQASEVPNEGLAEPEPDRRSTAIDMAQLGMDAVGVVDPTGLADGANAVISLTRAIFDKERRGEHLKNAAISAVSIIPYAGDLAKTLKLPGAAKTVRRAASLSDAAKAQNRAQYRQTASSVIDAFSDAGDSQQSEESQASSGGFGQPPSQPPAPPSIPPTGPGGSGEDPREATDRIRGQRELDKQTQSLTKQFEDLTFGVGATILAFAGLFETTRAINRANLERKTYLAEVNGDIARALAIREIATVQRNFREGETMEDALGRSARADTRMEDLRERVTSPLSSIGTDVTSSFANIIATVGEAADGLTGFSRGLKLASDVVGFFAEKIEQATRTARIIIDLFSPFGSSGGGGGQKGTATTRFLDDITDGKLDGKSKSGNFFS